MIAFGIVVAVIGGGACATYLYDSRSSLTTRICVGTCGGLTLFALIGFILASLLGFSLTALALATVIMAAPLALILRRNFRSAIRADVSAAACSARMALREGNRGTLASFLLLCAASVPTVLLFSQPVFQTADGVYTGIYTNRNDLPLHIAIIEGFVRGDNFPPEHPEFAGARLTYPFLVDFVPAQLILAGTTLPQAVSLQNIVLALALIVLLYRWALTLTGDRVAALLTPLLILLGSGLGWIVMLQDAAASRQDFLSFLGNLPHDYTINTRNLRWGNVATTMLVSQRSFLLGLSLFVVISTLWWRAVGQTPRSAPAVDSDEGARALRLMIGAGVIAGLLPLAHTHTFAVVMGMGAWLAIVFPRWRAWAAFFAVASLLALPQLWWVSRGSLIQTGSFVAWHFGWTKETEGIVWFWFKNTGVFVPLLAAALVLRGKYRLIPQRLIWFYLPFILCFIVPQLVRLAPRASANIKVLVFWYVVSAPLVGLVLARFWRTGLVPRLVAVGLVSSLTLAGALDVWRVLSGASAVRVFDAGEVAFAQMVQRTTAPRAIILHAPSRNHPVFLTGRRSLVGNPLHVASHGFDYKSRDRDIRRIYEGHADAVSLLERYGIEYVVVGLEERDRLSVDDRFFETQSLIGEAGGFALYKVRRVSHASDRHLQLFSSPVGSEQ
jgi:hypothetical protein